MAPDSLLLRVTLAFGTTAPDGSVIVPAISPEVSDCAKAGAICHTCSMASSKKIVQLRKRITNLR